MKKVSLLVGIALMLFPLGLGATAASADEVEAVPVEDVTEVDESFVEADDIVIEDVVETDATDVDEDATGDGLVPIEPSEASRLARGNKIPTQKHNVSKGQYNFSGNGYKSVLYTNKLLHGVKSYKVSVTNKGPKTVTVMFKTTKNTAKKFTVAAKKTGTATVKVGSASTNYYLRFSGDHFDVKGWVKK